MKKVLALVLAVMMLATVAFAAEADAFAKNRPIANVTPGSSIKIDKNGIKDTGTDRNKDITGKDDTDGGVYRFKEMDVLVYDENGNPANAAEGILRSVTGENYTVTNVKIAKVGKSLVSGVTINDKEERVEVKLVDDLDNQTAKDFEVSFKLKGKAKFTLRDLPEVAKYNAVCAASKRVVDDDGNYLIWNGTTTVEHDEDGNVIADGTTDTAGMIGKKVTLPDLSFTFIGTVGYGKVEVNLGDDGDEEIENLEDMGVKLDKDVVKFVKGGVVGNSKRVAGAYTADAILTQEYGDAMTMEARVYAGDVLFFDVDNDPDRDIVGRLADSDADMDFYIFNSNTKYTTFNSNVNLYFNNAEEEDFIYEIKNGKLVKTGIWSEDDDCWVVKARTLGAYVVSDVELKEFEAAAGSTDTNPDTGANDVVGIATALAAVALVSAAAVSLKK